MTWEEKRAKEESLLKDLFERVLGYLEESRNREVPVVEYRSPEELRDQIDLTLREEGEPENFSQWIDAYLRFSVRTGSPRFYNQLFSGFSLPGFIGEVITALTNTSIYTYEVAPLATLIERELIRTMAGFVGFEKFDGIFLTGGSNANLLAMLAARHTKYPAIKEEGFQNRRPLILYISEDAHYSFAKGVNLMGLGLENLVKVKTSRSGRMIPEELDRCIQSSLDAGKEPFFVGATAGTTVKGAFDPIPEIEKIANRYNLWMHIDGSLGASVLLSEKHRHLLKGCEKADSLTWDTHKMMGLPLICSTILFRHPHLLSDLNEVTGADYLFHEDSYSHLDMGKLSLQCGRRVDALKLWLAWKYYGHRGFETQIDHLFEMASLARDIITSSPHLELTVPMSSINICFRYIPDSLIEEQADPEGKRKIDTFNKHLRKQLLKTGKAFVNYSTIDDRPCFRLVIVNFDCTSDSIRTFFSDLKQSAEEISLSPKE